MKTVSSHLTNLLNSIPELPGIYKMLNSKGNIIYIGKSKCLKKRVKSYFANTPKWEKVTKMVSFIHDIDYVVTDTHLEARLLECELIKLHQPVFNSQLKSDNRYVYLKIENNVNYSPLSIVRERGENTLGPFRSYHTLSDAIDSLKNIYPISKIKRTYTFDYHILPVLMNEEIFHNNLSILKEILSSEKKLSKLISQAEKKMKEAASIYRYETASFYRDLIRGLQYINHGISGYQTLLSKDIILKIPVQNGFKLFWVSKGMIHLRQNYNTLNHNDINKFIMLGQTLPSVTLKEQNEKSYIDFRDILYSEIMSLSEDMVIILDNTSKVSRQNLIL